MSAWEVGFESRTTTPDDDDDFATTCCTEADKAFLSTSTSAWYNHGRMVVMGVSKESGPS